MAGSDGWRVGRKPTSPSDVGSTLQSEAVQHLHGPMILDRIEVTGNDQRLIKFVDYHSAQRVMLGGPAITIAKRVAGMDGHQPDGTDVGDTDRCHPLLKISGAGECAAAQWEAGVDRGVGKTVLGLAQGERKALVPPE